MVHNARIGLQYLNKELVVEVALIVLLGVVIDSASFRLFRRCSKEMRIQAELEDMIHSYRRKNPLR